MQLHRGEGPHAKTLHHDEPSPLYLTKPPGPPAKQTGTMSYLNHRWTAAANASMTGA